MSDKACDGLNVHLEAWWWVTINPHSLDTDDDTETVAKPEVEPSHGRCKKYGIGRSIITDIKN